MRLLTDCQQRGSCRPNRHGSDRPPLLTSCYPPQPCARYASWQQNVQQSAETGGSCASNTLNNAQGRMVWSVRAAWQLINSPLPQTACLIVTVTPLCRPFNITMMQGGHSRPQPNVRSTPFVRRSHKTAGHEVDRQRRTTNGYSHGTIGLYNASGLYNTNTGQPFHHQPSRATQGAGDSPQNKTKERKKGGGGQSSPRRPDYTTAPRATRVGGLALHLPARQELTDSPFVIQTVGWCYLLQFLSKPPIMAPSEAGAMETKVGPHSST